MVGYEFECLSMFEDDEIEDSLKKIFGSRLAKKFTVTTDCTIKRGRQTTYENGWSGWEIITPPLPNTEAIDVLDKVQDYLIQTGAVTNKSCGFHVNISHKNMKTFDPVTLISRVDEYKFAKSYDRENNPYCVPWSRYFEMIKKRIKRAKKTQYTSNIFTNNAIALIMSATNGDYVDDDDYRYAYNVSKYFDEKYTTINVSKLTMKDPYVEFRMMGGKDYHLKMLSPMVKELIEHIEYAANGRDWNSINQYFERYNVL